MMRTFPVWPMGVLIWLVADVPLRAQEKTVEAPPDLIASLGVDAFRHPGQIKAMAYSPDGSRLAIVGHGATLRIWDAASAKLISEHIAKVRTEGSLAAFSKLPGMGVAYSPDGEEIAVEVQKYADNETAIWVLDLKSGRFEQRTAYINHVMRGVTYSPDGKFFVRGGGRERRGNVTLWERDTGKKVERFQRHKGEEIREAFFSADGKRLATVWEAPLGLGYATRIWDVEKRSILREFDNQDVVAFSPAGKRALTASLPVKDKRELSVWDTDSGKRLSKFGEWTPARHTKPRFIDEDNVLEVDYAAPPRVRSVHCLTGKESWSENLPFIAHQNDQELRYSLDGSALLCRGQLVHGLPHKPQVRIFKHLEALGVIDYPLIVSPDKKTLVIAFLTLPRFFDLEEGKELVREEGHRDSIRGLAFFPDGRRLVSAGRDGSVRLWDVKAAKQLGMIYEGSSEVSIALAADGKTLAVCDKKEVLLFSPRHKEFVKVWRGDADHLVFSPDGSILAGRKEFDPKVSVWEVATGKTLFTIPVPERDKWLGAALAFSRDGKLLALGGGDREIRLLDSTSGKLKRKVIQPEREKVPDELRFDEGLRSPDYREIRHLAFSADGRFLYWVNNGGRLHRVLLDHDDSLVEPIKTSESLGWRIAFSPSGTTLLAGDHYGLLRLIEPVSGEPHHAFDRTRITVEAAFASAPFAFAPRGGLLAYTGVDFRIHLVDLWRQAKPQELDADQAEDAWKTLAKNGSIEEMKALRQNPETALRLLKDRVFPVPQATSEQIAGWLKDLESPTFAVREKATFELHRLHDGVVAELIEARKKITSLEAQRRVDKVLQKCLGELTPAQMRDQRSIDVLEAIGTPEAMEILRQWAKGAPQARLTLQAQGALRRLEKVAD